MRRALLSLFTIILWAGLAVSQTFTTATANLQHAIGTDGAFNPSRQVTALAGVDIIAVQERSTGETAWDSPMASAGLIQAIYRENHPDQGDGPAIWYKAATVTIDAIYSTDLQTGTLIGLGGTVVNKAAVAAKVTINGKQFYFVSTHLCWSACADSSGSQFSAQREGQINTLLSWINSTLTGGLDIIIAGDMNFGPDYPKTTGGNIKDLFTAGYDDVWNVGLTAGTATTPWGDRDVNGTADMTPADIGTQTTGTRTHDTRRIDYIFLKKSAVGLRLVSTSVPDGRATCSVALTTTGTFKECPDVDPGQRTSDVTDDQGVRPSDHNFVLAVFSTGPTAALSCPSTAFVGEVVVCDGSASTGVNGQAGWSTESFTDGTAPVLMDFGDSQGTYSQKKLLKAPHVYRSAGNYTVSLLVEDSAGTTSSTTTSIIVSNIPAAVGGNIVTLTDQGNNPDNCTALQGAINTAYGANTTEREIRLPAITYTCSLTTPAAVGTKLVTLMPANTTWLPGPLTRVTPALSSNMPKLQAPGADQTPLSVPAGTNRGYLRLLGIEVIKQAGTHIYNLIEVGSGATTYAELPTKVIVDRCYLHGNPTDDTNRGIFANAIGLTVINSYLGNLNDSGADAQAIAGFAADRIGIVNNFLEGYGENVMFGGADATIKFQATASSVTPTSAVLSSVSNLRVGDGISFTVGGVRSPYTATIVRSIAGSTVTFDGITNSSGTPVSPDTTSNAVRYGASPQDIFIAHNHLFKSLTFRVVDPSYAGTFAVVKNSFELKHAMRVVFEGNIVENMWGNQGQSGPTILFSPRNQTCYLLVFPLDPATCPEQTNPWTMVRDVQFTNNRLKNIADYINIIGTDNLNPPGTGDESGPSAFVRYIYVDNNLIEDLDPDELEGSAGSMLWIFPGARHVTVTHQTVLNISGGSPVGTEAAPIGTTSLDVKLVNSIFEYRDFGFVGDGSQGAAFVATFWPDGFVTHNVISDDLTTVTPGDWTGPRASPNYHPATINTNTFIDLGAGNYRLNPSSPYKAGNATPAADGLDIGMNQDTIEVATLHVIDGDWSAGPPSGGTGGRGGMKGKAKVKGKARIH